MAFRTSNRIRRYHKQNCSKVYIRTEVLVIAVGNFGAAGRKEICDIASHPCSDTVFDLRNYRDMIEVAEMAVKISRAPNVNFRVIPIPLVNTTFDI